jgi:DNA (cytosine-5)-methyltransferase 1
MLSEIKIATVCSGIGSPEQALKELNIDHTISFACEIDKYARQTYLANFSPNMMLTDMTKEQWIGEQYYADLIVAGLPCQSFSLAGKRLGENDPRGILFFDFYRYVKNQRPKYFIIENVKGLISDNAGKTFQNWVQLLGQSMNTHYNIFNHDDSLLYNLHFKVLNSKDFGLPQNRERVFLVGIRNDLPSTFRFPKGWQLTKRLKDVLEDNIDEKYYLSEKMCKGLIDNKYINQDTQASQVHNIFGVAPTLSAGTHGYALGYIKDISNTVRNGGLGSIDGKHTLDLISEPICLASRGRNHNDKIEQNLKPNFNGITNSITSVQKDNLILVGNLSGGKWDKTNEQSRRVYSVEGLSPVIHTMGGGNQHPKIQVKEAIIVQKGRGYNKGGEHDICPSITSNSFEHNNHIKQQSNRIRRLTPLECMRLQGFSDDFKQPVSDSQRYRQAGNTISVPLIKAILNNLIK